MRTYNTIISACNRSGQPEHALRVYERMLADGAQPTATTYTALISAYGKTGKVRWSRHLSFIGPTVPDSRVQLGPVCSADCIRHCLTSNCVRGDRFCILP